MADKQIGDLTAASTPLTGAELAHMVQGGNSRKVALKKFAGPFLLQKVAASGAASVELTAFSSDFDDYEIRFDSVVPQTDTAVLWMRASTDGGMSYDTGNNYRWESVSVSSGGTTVSGLASNSDSKFNFSVALGNATGENARGSVEIGNVNSASLYKLVQFNIDAYQSNPVGQRINSGGVYVNASVVNALQFLMSTGNISGNFYLYGVRKD